jgi:5-methylcytosine-specific restriction endonuclease McrA
VADRLESQFLKRTSQAYRDLQKRVAEKRDKRERVIRIGRPVPFTLVDFRQFARNLYGTNWTTQCTLCGYLLPMEETVWDHGVPLARGGSLDLTNLFAVHDACNRIKGKLNPAEFRALMRGLETFAETARQDILTRLKTGAGFQRLRYFARKPKTATPTPKEETAWQDPTSSPANGS